MRQGEKRKSFAPWRLCARLSGRMIVTESEIAKVVVDACYQIHTRLGPGLLESVYERILEHELKKRGLKVARQVPIPVVYDGMEFEEGFKEIGRASCRERV